MAQAGRVSRTFGLPGRLLNGLIDGLASIGEQLTFMGKSLADTLFAIRHGGEIARLVSEITLGAGALLVGAGTAGVIFFMAFFTGTQVGLEGFKGLQLIGAEAFTGFVSAFANTREITPLIAGVTLAAQVGAGFTAELGAMRVNEEIDALEVMAVRPVPYLVSTRIIAALIAIVPLYLISLFASYIATELVVTKLLGLSGGTYQHYFSLFLPATDVLYSLIKAVIFAIAVALIHCYYGFNASGGPAGVGVAVGKAIRASIVAVNLLNLMLSAFMWGVTDTVRIAG
ncbi:MAG: phospholipid/cholesterol/gamma-HCH transport system permease protein [Actinomycetota bacterium]|jgi:phospholipid/cholesterol/gamma-HCH transport system permease protein|nr:phospholipid/cholesterol/gamma-HCH transport system permease protein [Actinomycetota bacterium]